MVAGEKVWGEDAGFEERGDVGKVKGVIEKWFDGEDDAHFPIFALNISPWWRFGRAIAEWF